MQYDVRKGAVLVCIQGQYMIIADKEARKYCPYMLTLNESGATFWKRIQEGDMIEKIVEDTKKEYDVEESVIRSDLTQFVEEMMKCGYLVPREQGGNEK